jgi:phosphodiesterase/alkaline phosphatase D-like protein
MVRRYELTRREVMVAGAVLTACSGKPSPESPPTIDAQSFDHSTAITFSPEDVAASEALFPLTVSSGAMRPDSVLLWTRAETVAEVTLRVWRAHPTQTMRALVSEKKLAVPADGNVRVTVDGLAPATWYQYAFFDSSLERRSPIGKVRTAFPDAWLEPVTVGATSCASYRYAPFAPLVTMGSQPLDLWLHLGDVSYNDGAGTLSEFRAKWRTQLADPGYRALMPSTGGYLVWDDHDFQNSVDAEALGPTHPLIVSAKQAWFETLPVERGEGDRIWRSYRWGKTVEFFLMDCRMERKPSTLGTGKEEYLSRAQMDWLKDSIKNSPCHFKALLNSVPITTMPPPLWGAQNDRWQGYPAAREELLGFLDAEDVRNVWFISGDFHLGLVMRVERAGVRRRLIEIAVGPAGNINPLELVLEPGQDANKKIAFPPDQFLFAGGAFATTTLTFDPKADTVRVVFFNPKTGVTTYDQALTFGAV